MEYTKERSGLNSWYKKLQYLFNKLVVKNQKTYILPTKFGLAYGALCFVLLLMGMAYGNNLVYIVCFYLTTMGLALAKITNDNVDQVLIEKSYIKEVFAESDQTLFVVIRNKGKESLKQIEVRISKKESYIFKTDLKPEETQTLELIWKPTQRGHQKIPSIRVQASFPAGLFEAWKILKGQEDVVIFPARAGRKEFPQSGAASDSIGILKEIREYKAGDSPKRIHWRSLAKSGQLRTLIHEGNESQICQLGWDQVQHLQFENRLEQISLWISMAQLQGAPWTLKLPHTEYDSQNMNAFKLAMTELALWKKP